MSAGICPTAGAAAAPCHMAPHRAAMRGGYLWPCGMPWPVFRGPCFVPVGGSTPEYLCCQALYPRSGSPELATCPPLSPSPLDLPLAASRRRRPASREGRPGGAGRLWGGKGTERPGGGKDASSQDAARTLRLLPGLQTNHPAAGRSPHRRLVPDPGGHRHGPGRPPSDPRLIQNDEGLLQHGLLATRPRQLRLPRAGSSRRQRHRRSALAGSAMAAPGGGWLRRGSVEIGVWAERAGGDGERDGDRDRLIDAASKACMQE